MSTPHPYTRREALPISYFPFLSARDAVSPAAALAFRRRLEGRPARPEDALVYVHIPFCENICGFCGFYRRRLAEFPDSLAAFTENLVREIRLWAAHDRIQALRIGAVYIGGGSPSVLPLEQLDRLLGAIRSHLPLPPGVEFSFEGEVRSLRDPAKLALLREHGFYVAPENEDVVRRL